MFLRHIYDSVAVRICFLRQKLNICANNYRVRPIFYTQGNYNINVHRNKPLILCDKSHNGIPVFNYLNTVVI